MKSLNHNRNSTRRTGVIAAFALSLTTFGADAAFAQAPADPGNVPAPAPAPAPGGQSNPVEPTGAPEAPGFGTAGNQTQGTPTGAAAQGNSATNSNAPVPAAALPPLSQQPGRAPQNSRISVTSTTALSPIIARAQDMLRVARGRQEDAPSGARQAYRSASQALNQMLSAAGYASAGSNSSPMNAASRSGMGNASAMLSSMPVMSEQITEDIRVLRSLSRQNGSAQSGTRLPAARMEQVASLYATGAKEFFTAQLREALLESPVRVTMRTNGSRVEGVAASTGAAAVRSDRPQLPFPVTLQQPSGDASTNTAANSALPADPAPEPPSTAVDPIIPSPGNVGVPVGGAPFGAGGGFVTPNVQIVPNGGYGNYLFGPPSLIIGGYGPTANMNGVFPYIPFF